MILWIILALIGLVTYCFRLSFILLLERISLSPSFERALRFVPPAALSALIWPALLVPDGTVDLTWDNHRFLAGIFAAVIAWWTRSVLLTTILGMTSLWLLDAFLG